MMKKLPRWLLVLGTGLANVAAAATVAGLRCEHLKNPNGLDEARPALSWLITSERRGETQSAYQVLAASTSELLAADKGDLWDSGKVASGATAQVEYAGQALASRGQCVWKVRIWDRDGTASAWSQTAAWSMGLLQASDWKSLWISDPTLADPANRPMTPTHCYRSELATRPDAAKWIVLDLGTAKHMDAVDLMPARPQGQNPDFRTAMFPRRFKLELADKRDFSDAHTVVDHTTSDEVGPRSNSSRYPFTADTARYVRLTVTRLAQWDGQDYGIALGGFAVFDGAQSIAVGAGVECSDSMETDQWSKKFLVDGKAAVALASAAPVLDAGMPDAKATATVSRVPMLRREFDLAGGVRRATLSVSARGFYEVRINGKRVGEDLLAPGFTDYGTRLQYQSHDVTRLLRRGNNAIGALIGYGWYAGHLNLMDMKCIYGYFPQLLAQLDVELMDGTNVCLGTDGQWRSTLEGPVRWSDLLDGEGYDCRRELSGWDQPGFNDRAWQPVWSQPRDATPLVWPRCQPVRAIREVKPVAVKEVRPGTYVFDLGQEISGWCRVKVNGPAGSHVRLRHSELVGADGALDVGNLWGTLQQEDYILDGKAERTLEPHFTYHGFRYVELTGLPGKPKSDSLIAVNLRSDVSTAGRFESSNDLYNRIQTAATWTQANMMFDVPNGCAARSERLAWSGDIRPCVQALMFNFDTAAFLNKYAIDQRDDQTADGRFTDIAPHAHLRGCTICVGSPGWADAGVSLPWEVYVNTGDKRLLSQHFDAARRWVDAIHASNPDLRWRNNRGQDWGDWLSAGRATPKDIGATAFFAHSADLVSRMAQVLGRKAEAGQYHTLFEGIRQGFVKDHVSANGIIGGTTGGQPIMRDVTTIVRGLVKNGKLAFTVKNEVLGGDPALNHVKSLHLSTRNGTAAQEQEFGENAAVLLTGKAGKPLEIIAASYGYDAADPGDAQGSYAIALQFGLLDEPLRALAAKRLAQLVVRNGHHPTTGFWSSIELLLSLSNTCYHEDAAEMLNQRDQPSWGYMVDHSTTFWEAFNANSQNLSLNHWTHSAVSEWLWRNVAGINPDEQHPGYQSFNIRPLPTKEVNWCNASYDSIRGKIATRWKIEGDKFTLAVTVPPNTTATVFVPSSDANSVTESAKPTAQAEGVKLLRQDNGTAVFQVSSGSYQFTSRVSLK